MQAERSEEEVKSSADSKDRTVSYLQTEVARLKGQIQNLHGSVNESEHRADQAVTRERGKLRYLFAFLCSYCVMFLS